jgi:uncharacterized protein (TIGR01319 family)
MAYDLGSTFTKIAAFNLKDGDLTYIGRSQAPTTIDNILIGMQNARYNLFNTLDIKSMQSDETYATSSAAGGLRMVAMGYMPRVTAKAAKEVAMSAGARVLEIVSYEDDPGFKIEVLREIKPDLILLAGGTDGGDQESMMHNASAIVESKIESVVIVAGNVEAQPRIEGILKNGNVNAVRAPNVMPTIHQLNVRPARQIIHEQFIRQITRAGGLGKLIEMVTNGKVLPTPGAVLMGAELLALGTRGLDGIGDLLVVDVGGATTDVHSALFSLQDIPDEEKGLIVNNEKQVLYRTVEGNLGIRISAGGILDAAGPTSILKKVDIIGEEFEQRLSKYVAYLEKNPDHISTTDMEQLFDEGLAIAALEIALKRHAGCLSQEYDPVAGIAPGTPIGRDLRKVRRVIGVGGVLAHARPDKAVGILTKALANPALSLLPKRPEIIIDGNYLMYAIGVLSQIYPEATLRFAKRYLEFNEGGNGDER